MAVPAPVYEAGEERRGGQLCFKFSIRTSPRPQAPKVGATPSAVQENARTITTQIRITSTQTSAGEFASLSRGDRHCRARRCYSLRSHQRVVAGRTSDPVSRPGLALLPIFRVSAAQGQVRVTTVNARVDFRREKSLWEKPALQARFLRDNLDADQSNALFFLIYETCADAVCHCYHECAVTRWVCGRIC